MSVASARKELSEKLQQYSKDVEAGKAVTLPKPVVDSLLSMLDDDGEKSETMEGAAKTSDFPSAPVSKPDDETPSSPA